MNHRLTVTLPCDGRGRPRYIDRNAGKEGRVALSVVWRVVVLNDEEHWQGCGRAILEGLGGGSRLNEGSICTVVAYEAVVVGGLVLESGIRLEKQSRTDDLRERARCRRCVDGHRYDGVGCLVRGAGLTAFEGGHSARIGDTRARAVRNRNLSRIVGSQWFGSADRDRNSFGVATRPDKPLRPGLTEACRDDARRWQRRR